MTTKIAFQTPNWDTAGKMEFLAPRRLLPPFISIEGAKPAMVQFIGSLAFSFDNPYKCHRYMRLLEGETVLAEVEFKPNDAPGTFSLLLQSKDAITEDAIVTSLGSPFRGIQATIKSGATPRILKVETGFYGNIESKATCGIIKYNNATNFNEFSYLRDLINHGNGGVVEMSTYFTISR